jgi:hypothetical protein
MGGPGGVVGSKTVPAKSEGAVARGLSNEVVAASGDPEKTTHVFGAENEQLAGQLHQLVMGKDAHITFGKIRYSLPGTGWYQVYFDEEADARCCMASESSSQPFAAISGATLPPNTSVVVLRRGEKDAYGVILGAIPDIVGDNDKFRPDQISQGSNIGLRIEGYYKKLFTALKKQSGVIDWSMGQPRDTTALGEWSRITALGNGIFIDPFMVFARIDETCGLWLHYFDRLARLSGYNLDIRTAISEEIARNDEGEGMLFHGSSPFPWEVLGAFSRQREVHTTNENQDVQYDAAWYAKREPSEDDLMPFYRLEEYRGYLGQGFMRQVILPPQDIMRKGDTQKPLNQYDSSAVRLGVFREQIGLDGSYALQSAHSITVAKRCLIPVPKRKKLVEDDTGDVGAGPDEAPANYRFAGQGSDGDEHKITGTPTTEGDLKSCLTAAALLDQMSHTFNWKGLHPFYYHKEDFETPQQNEMGTFSAQQAPPDFSELSSKTFMEQPSPIEGGVYVDERVDMTSQNYWETQAGWAILPDGGYVLRDGYGGEIRMTGGCIQLSCPGDIMLQPGRSLVGLGGDDVIMRANKSLDLSAANKDLRIKAEHNLEILGANSGQGRMLIESRSRGRSHDDADKLGEEIESESGIVLRAAQSEISTMANWLYLRTGNSEGGIGEGDVVIDAAQGNRDVHVVGRELDVHLESYKGMNISFPGKLAEKTDVYRFGSQICLLPESLYVNGNIWCAANVITQDWFFADGHIATMKDSPHIWTSTSANNPKNKIEDKHDQAKTERMGVHAEQVQGFWWDSGKIGYDEVQEKTTFGFRNEEQYGTEDFSLPETYWQQLVRMGAGGASGWSEPYVQHGSVDTMPWPGERKWKGSDNFLQVEFSMWDTENNVDMERPEPYEDPTISWKDRQQLNGYYPVISD